MSCKTLVTTRSFSQPTLFNNKWLNAPNIPEYIRYYFGNATIPTNCTLNLSTATEITVPVSKRKESQYGKFNIDLLGEIVDNTNFEYRFKVNLKANGILSQTINSNSLVLNNTRLIDINDEFPPLFQPLFTNVEVPINIFGVPTLDVFGTKYGTITLANSYCSFGFTYESGSLVVYYIYQSLNTCGTYSTKIYQSSPIVTSGSVNISLVKTGGIVSFVVNGLITNVAIELSEYVKSSFTYFGKITDAFYETRYLYSDICNIYCIKDNEVIYESDLSDIQLSDNNIVVNSLINSNILTLYNYNFTDIQDLNVCCPIIQLVNADNSELGCCFTPTVEDNIKYKINNWYLNSLGFSSIEYAEMMLKIGKNKEANEKLEKINSVHQFVFYIMSIRNRMVCEGKPYTDFVSDETLNTFVEYFNCRGINIKCPLQIAMIGKYTNCCDQIEASVDCECTDEIPSAIISAPIYQYDLASEADQTLEYTQLVEYPGPPSIVPFSCCSGNQSMEVSTTLINPSNLPISITPGALTTDGTFSYDITYEYIGSVVTDVKEFYVQFTICGQTILRKHLYSAVDNCVTTPSTPNPIENLIASVTLDIDDDNFGTTMITDLYSIDLGNFECCHTGQSSKVISIDISRITSESGLTILGPKAEDEAQGTIPLSYYFNGEIAIAGTVQRIFITYSICDDLVYTGYIEFTVVNTCVADSTPVFDPVSVNTVSLDLGSIGSGTRSVQIGVTDYQCCQRVNDFAYYFLGDPTFSSYTELALYGITFLSLPSVLNPARGTNNISFSYNFNRNTYLLNLTSGAIPYLPDNSPRYISIQFVCQMCVDEVVTPLTYTITFSLEDTCTPTLGINTSTQITLDLYTSLGRQIPVNSQLTFECAACDNSSGQFSYEGFKFGSNNLNLVNSVTLGSDFASPSIIPFGVIPHTINIGVYNSGTYPSLAPATTVILDTPCSGTTDELVVNGSILDNFMRSEGGAGLLQPVSKTKIIGYDSSVDSNIMFIVHVTDTSALRLEEFSYVNLVSSGSNGRIRTKVYSLGANTINYSGVYTQNNGDVGNITNVTVLGSALAGEYQTALLVTDPGPTTVNPTIQNVNFADGFYAVVISFENCTIDYITAEFDIV